MYIIKPVDYSVVSSVWHEHLWPERNSRIEPQSPLQISGGYCLDYYNREVDFVAACNYDGEIIGVASGFITEPKEYRLRGMFVFENHRTKGVGRKLLNWLEDQAKEKKATSMWTLPRKSNLDFYSQNNFRQISDWIFEFEYGPNCFAMKKL